jgi:hypothetical protein
MTLQLKSDRHPSFGPGFALLIFDRPINAIRLEISVFNTITGLYLGASMPGKPSWIRQQTHFFPAVRAGGENSRTFRVGPEITSYIQEGTYVEIATRDGSIREEVSWEGVLQRFKLTGTENWFYSANADELGPDDAAVKQRKVQDEAAEAQRAREDAEKLRVEQEAAAAKRRADDAAKGLADKEAKDKIAADAAAKQRALDDTAAAKQREIDEAAAKLVEQDAERLRAVAAGLRAAKRGIWLKQAGKYLVGVLIVLAAAAGAYQTYRSGVLCDRFGLFCDQETAAFRTAQSCATGKTCGAASCTVAYHRDFPGGAHIADINRIDASPACVLVDAEKELFDRAVRCANERERVGNVCAVAACFDDFKTRYPASTRLNAEQAQLQHNRDACSRAQEKSSFDPANECATRTPCDTTCFNAYRARYPNGLFKGEMDTAMARARNACPPPRPTPTPIVTPTVTPTPIVTPTVRPSPTPLPQIKRRTDEKPDTNCNRATKPIEQMLCYDGDLAQADGELGAAYNRKLGTVTNQEPLRQSEREWLARRNTECGIQPSGTWTEMDLRQAKNCLLQVIRDRTNELSR